jgi:hypothetical protein
VSTLAIFSREFVLDLCDGEDVLVTETLYFCRIRGYVAAITPTIAHSLMDMANVDQNHDAMRALFELRGADPIMAAPVIPGLKNGYADIAAKEIMAKLDLPESRRNLCLIIGEASVLEAKYLILDDAELDGLDVAKINPILVSQNLAPLHIYGRGEFFGFVSGQRE